MSRTGMTPIVRPRFSTFANWAEVAQWAAKRYHISDADKQVVSRELLPNFKIKGRKTTPWKSFALLQDEVRYLGLNPV